MADRVAAMADDDGIVLKDACCLGQVREDRSVVR
jgi:hypothetical protein